MNHPDNKQEPNRKKNDESASDKLKNILSSRKSDEQIINDVSSSSLDDQKKTAEIQPESSKPRSTKKIYSANNLLKTEVYLRS